MNRRILIVDEDRRVLEHLCRELRSTEHRLEVHVSAESAWASIDRDLPDVVVLDAKTAGLLGRPFVEDLRQHFGERLRLVVAGSRDAGAEDGRVGGREARLPRPLSQAREVQRAVSRLLRHDAAGEPVEPDSWEVAVDEAVGAPQWETPADGFRERCLRLVSQELRTPLTVLSNLLSVMASRSDDEELCAAASHQIRRLDHQIDRVILVANHGHGGAEAACEVFDLRPVVEDSVDSSYRQAEDRGSRLTLCLPDTPVWVRANSDDLRRAVYELAEFAVKCTPAPGEISLSVERGGGQARIVFQVHVIDADSRDHGELRGPGGPVTRTFDGVGLFLARGLVEAWGGSIGAESEEGAGATFHLDVPAAGGREGLARSGGVLTMSPGRGSNDV